MRLIAIETVLLLAFTFAFGQPKTQFISGQLHSGFIIPHSPEIRDISSSNPISFQLNYSWLRQSKKNWASCNCLHELGISFSYLNFRNKEVLGSALSLSGFFEPYLIHKKKWYLSLQSGIGVSYLSKVYDSDHNPKNLFFSSPLSFLIFLTPTFNYRISEEWSGKAELSYNHISNGGQQQPNKGMNYPTIGIGASYSINPSVPDNKNYSRAPLQKNWKFFMDLFSTTRDNVTNGDRSLLIGTSAGTLKPISPINGLGAGIEFSYDPSLRRDELIYPDDNAPFTMSILAGHHFLLGKFDFNQRMGYYIFRPYNFVDTQWFQRYAIHYELFENVRIGASLKAHGQTAENIDIRLGILF